jgi:ATP-dependent RNA helicase DDX1
MYAYVCYCAIPVIMCNDDVSYATGVDLKGKDSVPETVDHAVIIADAATDNTWKKLAASSPHDGIHTGLNPNGNTPDCYSFGAKTLKLQIFAQLIDEYKMDQCMIFCRTQV